MFGGDGYASEDSGEALALRISVAIAVVVKR